MRRQGVGFTAHPPLARKMGHEALILTLRILDAVCVVLFMLTVVLAWLF
jgi:hypothetical protein